jgi:uncharacterized membrane protein YeiH
MRDVFTGEVPLVLRQGELYVTAALAGAVTALAAIALGASVPVALMLCAGACWGLRAGSLAFGWALPVYRSRPPRA